MNISEISKSNTIKADDLQGKRVAVTIEDVQKKEFDRRDGNGKDKKFVLFFVGKEKQMVCNITNARMIAMLVGSEETADWVGRSIYIHVGMTPMGPGIQVDSELPPTDAGPLRRLPTSQTNAVTRHATAADREFGEEKPDYVDDDTEPAF